MGCTTCSLIAAFLAFVCGVLLRVPPARVTDAMIRAQGHKSIRRSDGLYADGRVVEYKVVGDMASDNVVVAIHGWMSSVKGWSLYEPIALELGLKMILVGIPGFGLSEGPPPGVLRDVKDFAADVDAVVKAEGVQKYHVLGYSSGGLHAAVASKFNKNVQNLLLITPIAPASVEGHEDAISQSTKISKWIWTIPYLGEAYAWLLARCVTAKQRLTIVPDMKAACERFDREGSNTTKVLLDDQDYALHHTFRGLSLEGAHTIRDPLPFPIEELQVQGKVAVAFAPDDTTNPPQMARWFCDHIPGCALLEHEVGYGHLFGVVPRNARRILSFLKTGKAV